MSSKLSKVVNLELEDRMGQRDISDRYFKGILRSSEKLAAG